MAEGRKRGRPRKEDTPEGKKAAGIAKRVEKITLPEGYLARGVPGDYDGGWELPDAKHEKFAHLRASGATATSAIKRAHPKGAQLKTPIQSGARLDAYEHIKRRVRWLREEKARTLASEESMFAGFVHAVETAMTSIADLVKLCELEGLHREASAARSALGSLAGRTFTHRSSLQNADSRGRLERSTAKRALKELLA